MSENDLLTLESNTLFPVQEAANEITKAARSMGYKVRRNSASAFSRSSYLFCSLPGKNIVEVRVADHEGSKMPSIDVHTDGTERPGSVDVKKAIEWLQGKIC